MVSLVLRLKKLPKMLIFYVIMLRTHDGVGNVIEKLLIIKMSSSSSGHPDIVGKFCLDNTFTKCALKALTGVPPAGATSLLRTQLSSGMAGMCTMPKQQQFSPRSWVSPVTSSPWRGCSADCPAQGRSPGIRVWSALAFCQSYRKTRSQIPF